LAVIHSLRRLLAMVIGIVVVFVVGFVPLIGPIAALAVTVWLAAHASAYDCYDAILARRQMAYRAKLAYLGRNRMRTQGLGAAVAVLLMIPGVNLIALGIGAAGATVAALDMEGALPVIPESRARYRETA